MVITDSRPVAEEENRDASAEPVAELPPRCKLVYKMLKWEGRLTTNELAAKTMLSPRTIRYATDRLEENSHITAESYMTDARQSVYAVNENGSLREG